MCAGCLHHRPGAGDAGAAEQGGGQAALPILFPGPGERSVTRLCRPAHHSQAMLHMSSHPLCIIMAFLPRQAGMACSSITCIKMEHACLGTCHGGLWCNMLASASSSLKTP